MGLITHDRLRKALDAAGCSKALATLTSAEGDLLSDCLILRERRILMERLRAAGVAPLGQRQRAVNVISELWIVIDGEAAVDPQEVVPEVLAVELAAVHVNEAQALKAKGNQFYGHCEYAAAASCYRDAMLLHTTVPTDTAVLASNLSAALLRGSMAAEALQAADEAVAVLPDWPKAYLRRAEACFELQRYGEALAAYKRAAQLAKHIPGDPHVSREASLGAKLAAEAEVGGVWIRPLRAGLANFALRPLNGEEGVPLSGF